MEVHDFDQEHLESVLLKDEDGHHVNETVKLNIPHARAAVHRPATATGGESNTSKERYALLPDYAQESFVNTTSDETSTFQSSLTIQDSREDVEQNLPKHIKTVGFFVTLLINERATIKILCEVM